MVDNWTVFAPLGPRLAIFGLWCVPLVYPLATILGPFTAPQLALACSVAAVSCAIGLVVSLRLRLEVSPEGVSYVNVFRRGSYRWEEITEITLRRYFVVGGAEEHVRSSLPRVMNNGGLALPTVALRLKNGRLSPNLTVTAFCGQRNRNELTSLLEKEGGQHGVFCRIVQPNKGWLFGTSWDTRPGHGLKPVGP